MSGKNSLRRALIKERRAYAARPDTKLRADAIMEACISFCMTQCTDIAAALVFCYVGDGWEVPTAGIIESLLADGIRVCVPRCRNDGEKGIMDAVEITSLSDLHRGMYDLLEPDEDAPAVDPASITLAIVPATAFDTAGYRLGRGGGYYDRFLTLLQPDCVTVGLAYDAFVLDAVPKEEYDLAVTHILTETGPVWLDPK